VEGSAHLALDPSLFQEGKFATTAGTTSHRGHQLLNQKLHSKHSHASPLLLGQENIYNVMVSWVLKYTPNDMFRHNIPSYDHIEH
jgi:hypothetical protein